MALPLPGRALRGTVLPLVLAFGGVQAHAQAFDGEWIASYTSGSGNAREADVRIAGREGSWALRPRPGKDKKDPCVGRPFPLVLSDSGAGTAVLRVEASATVSGCDDRTLNLQALDAKTLAGQFSNGTAVTLTRR
ncbi:MAG: hypothetical protein JSR41_18140 [Proteobacteria bacterium]|nr:hypothetical protein [Pseudomonadota bacterium]